MGVIVPAFEGATACGRPAHHPLEERGLVRVRARARARARARLRLSLRLRVRVRVRVKV